MIETIVEYIIIVIAFLFLLFCMFEVLKIILKVINRIITTWKPIKEPPKWVWMAYYKWRTKKKIPSFPFKYFKGKHYIYRVEHEVGQGKVIIIGWNKRRYKK